MSPANSSSSAVKLFVGGLSYDTTDASLSRYFEKYGQLESAVVLRDPETLRSRGFGFVTFTDKKHADEVLNSKRHMVDGRKVETKLAVPRNVAAPRNQNSSGNGSGSSGSSNSKQNSNIKSSSAVTSASTDGRTSDSIGKISGSIPGGTSSSPVSSLSSSSSSVDSSTVINNNKTSSGSTRSRKKGEKSSNIKKQERNPLVPNKIFVGGLLYATGHDSLKHYFEQFGVVDMAEVIYNKDTKKSRGFGFVVFQDFEAVSAVLDTQVKARHVIDGKHVEVKLCVARQESPSSGGKNNSVESKSAASLVAPKPSKPLPKVAPPPAVNQWHQKSLITSFAQAVAIGTEHEKQTDVTKPIQVQVPAQVLAPPVPYQQPLEEVQSDPVVIAAVNQEIETSQPQGFVDEYYPSQSSVQIAPLQIDSNNIALDSGMNFSESLGFASSERNPVQADNNDTWSNFNTGVGVGQDYLGVNVVSPSLFDHGPSSPLASFLSPSSNGGLPGFHEDQQPLSQNDDYIDHLNLPPASLVGQDHGAMFSQSESVDDIFSQHNYQGFSMFGVPHHQPLGAHNPHKPMHFDSGNNGRTTAGSGNESQ
mmetsp:Transcript_8618/g.11263  ORF Transcript_8618/g.11263 Transcript_8618/m.11263 type:complete len:589 (-) Transcript_8618:985-2751(-)|eukprot:CAMPEP_0204875818 /NCGR_PEP_ID=MMETSP1348-20121228/46992_1 /ASSEMBLY_ACC=CAM_ASM_000700 /TAXON_ID=215587 /ORGANISM="Aplanochytrium stocchinoi, Strain GSBS06" /LENGTH=588 /DNA_ID=CAMNT_0052032445 /DNA_START=91 /DNA_END=1857 /DNA_ORIENTATION=-